MDYACAPPGRKTRLKRTISNTRTVRSGRLWTAPSIRGRGLSAHSYDVAFMSWLCFPCFCIAFHCILINTWLNQKRMSLLITQDKKNTTLHTEPLKVKVKSDNSRALGWVPQIYDTYLRKMMCEMYKNMFKLIQSTNFRLTCDEHVNEKKKQ